jgi:hypothetical protein
MLFGEIQPRRIERQEVVPHRVIQASLARENMLKKNSSNRKKRKKLHLRHISNQL